MYKGRTGWSSVAEIEEAVFKASGEYAAEGTPEALRVFYLHPRDYSRLLGNGKFVDCWLGPHPKMAGVWLIPHFKLNGRGVDTLLTVIDVCAKGDAYLTSEY